MARALFLVSILASLGVVDAMAQTTVRPFNTDRPDRTEGPYTVPMGWVQIEGDLVSYGHLKNGDETVNGADVASFNLKYGVTPRLDLQFVFSPWVHVHTTAPGVDDSDNGTGQAGLRAKYNLFGDDGGDAAALLPFAFIPTRGSPILDAATWGILAPVTVGLNEHASLSSMLGATRVNNDDWWFTASVSLGRDLVGGLAGFVETYASSAGFKSGAPNDVTIDTGVTFAPGDRWQLDTGAYFGVTADTERWRVFVGASARLPAWRS